VSDPPSTKRVTIVALVAVFALGSFLRLYNLGGASLWIDEITFVNESRLPSPVAVWNKLLGTYHWQHQPALPRMIEWIWLWIVERAGLTLNEAIYRIPAALMGIASIGVMFLLAKRMFGESIGLLSAFLWSISFFHIYYSREAYNYSPFILCALLSWYWLVRVLEEAGQGGAASRSSLIWYCLTTALVLQMMLAGIMFAICEFLALVLAVWTTPFRGMSKSEQSRRLRPIVIAFTIAWLPFLPFLWKIFHYVSADRHEAQLPGIVSFLKMLGEMGWSSQPVPLALFLLCVATGITLALRDPARRNAAWLCLVLGVFGAVGIGYLERLGRYESRYFIGLLPALILFAALALVWAGEKWTRRLAPSAQRIAWIVFAAVLLAWHLPFYTQLYALKGKLLCGRAIARWIVSNTPPGSVYVIDSVYVRREVPDFYPTPDRFVASPAPHSSYTGNEEIGKFIRSVFARFPDCYFVDTQHDLFIEAGQPSAWLETFRRHVRLENPALVRLYRLGVLPSGAFWRNMAGPFSPNVATDIYFNTKEDLYELYRQRGWFALFDPEWVYAEIPLPQGAIDHWKGLHGTGRMVVHGTQETTRQMKLRLRCGSYRVAQTISVEVAGNPTKWELAKDNTQWLDLGEITVQPGENVVVVRKEVAQDPKELANFMVREVTLEPVEPR